MPPEGTFRHPFAPRLEVVTAPVVSRRANHVSITVHGDNANIVYIDNHDADLLRRSLIDYSRRTGEQRLPMPGAPQGEPEHHYVEGARARWLSEDGPIVGTASELYRTLRDNFAPSSGGRKIGDARTAVEPQITGSMGTLLNLRGQWYVRPEGYSGALFPLDEFGFDVRRLSPEKSISFRAGFQALITLSNR